ncbi:MAG: hypothetical protein HQM09_25205, partial [Candidatus Riflebacteria bacterium]|nr:hypothetical protein [Candidatus Riflebacteria bacterium]
IDKVIAADKNAIIEFGNIDPTISNGKGMSIYFPAIYGSFESEYTQLNFCKSNIWPQMVQDFYKKQTAATVVNSVACGDISVFRSFVQESKDVEMNKFVADQLNFRMHAEGDLPKSIVEEASSIMRDLTTK